jgi:2-haloalkanoic acid dehalogenase type II
MRLGDFAALTFDCYGTLIDWEQGILIELKPWVQKNGLTIGDDEILAAFAEIEPKYQAETPDKLYPDVLTAVYLDLGKRWRIPADFDDAVAFGQSVGRWPAFPDSTPSLRYLKRHYKLVILSNVDRASFAESNKKLGVSFDRIITAQDVGSWGSKRNKFFIPPKARFTTSPPLKRPVCIQRGSTVARVKQVVAQQPSSPTA